MSRGMEPEANGNHSFETDSDSGIKKNSVKSRIQWTQEEDDNLRILVNNFGKKNWRTIASFLPRRTELQCMHRWNEHLDPNLIKGFWTAVEDEKLVNLVTLHGTKDWNTIASQLKGRIGKQCRDRWFNHLEASTKKNNWTSEEDLIIYKAHLILGNRWTEISKLLPGRSDSSVKHHWNSVVRQKAESGVFKEDSDSISLDIQQFTEGEVDFKCDVVLDAEPVAFAPAECEKPTQQKEEKKEPQKEPQKVKQKVALPPPKNLPSKTKLTSSSSTPHPAAKSSSSTTAAAMQVEQKKFAEAALRMIAEDMLPLSFVEGAGFRSFMNAMSPEHHKLSQRSMGLLLYDEVEKTIKPQLIRDLKTTVATANDSEGIIHVTFDLWTGQQPKEEVFVVVQLHFINQSWQVCRPVVAFRHLSHENLSAAVARELEGVLLSYGIFPNSIGYVLVNRAKEALAANSLFCDYKVLCSSSRGEPDGDDLVAFLSDQTFETESIFSELQIGTSTTCIAKTLHAVIKDALKNSRVVENLLLQVHSVVAFFKRSIYWSEVLLKECNLSLCPPSMNCRWNSMMLSLRRMVQESSWNAIMILLAQARIEANDAASAPPLVKAKREQVMDILGLLEPFEEALQVLQGNGLTLSYIIPSLVGLDKTLETCVSNYSHFCKALRSGLHTQFQSLIHQKDLVLAAVLDPRIKLKPFSDTKLEDQATFLTPPTKHEAQGILENALESSGATLCVPVKTEIEAVSIEQAKTLSENNEVTEPNDDVTDDCKSNEIGVNDLKRKSIFNFLQPPAKTMKLSEVEVYLSEPQYEGSAPVNMYWRSATRFPRLQNIVKKLLAAPATSGGFDRLCPMASCIVRAKRNRLPPHTTERLLLYKNFVKTKTVKKPSGIAKH